MKFQILRLPIPLQGIPEVLSERLYRQDWRVDLMLTKEYTCNVRFYS